MRGFNAFEAGLILLPAAIINVFLSPVTGKSFDRFGATTHESKSFKLKMIVYTATYENRLEELLENTDKRK